MRSKILFLVVPYANLLDIAGAAHVFFEAQEFGLPLDIEYCSFEEKIHSSSHLPIGPMVNYREQTLRSGDYLFIASGDAKYMLTDALRPEPELLQWIVQAHQCGATICAVCNGAFLLAQTGLLNYRNCTTHWKRTAQLQAKYPKAKVLENVLFVEDGCICTSAGAASGIDMALHLLSKMKDDFFAYEIARELVIYKRRAGSHAQQSIYLSYRNHVHAGIHRVQDWLIKHLDHKASLLDLAAIANMSDRNFTRVFKRETSITVNQYITLLRQERIRELLKNPDISRKQIAQHCGLKSEKQISRLMKQVA
jgi:transcriptional regulator GlxA family with amidase domain